MQLSSRTGAINEINADLVVVGRFSSGGASVEEITLDNAFNGQIGATAERMLFKGKARQKVGLDSAGRVSAQRVLLLGLGEKDKVTPAILRDFGAAAIDEALAGRLSTVAIRCPLDDEQSMIQVALGAQLATYRFTDLMAEPEEGPRPEVKELQLVGTASEAALSQAERIAEGVNLARTLINEPANICTPERMAELSEDIAKAPGFELTVLDRAEIKARGMGGLIGVSQGATREPRFIHLKYTPVNGTDEGAIALVGKGLTFDSGGLCIKPAKGMSDMYIDMGGSAAVFGAMQVVATMQPNIAVHGIVGACENMTGPDAYRPSDVLTMYSGKTVEIINTDAEGRLVLADALHYANGLKPRCIVDLATLTGACMVGLGPNYAGLFSDDDELATEIKQAADRAGENLWRMPLDPKLAETLNSKRADITNLGGPYGGAITAAQFLQNFKGDSSWAHIDLAGPILTDKDDGYIRTGGTGFGVMTLWSLISGASNN